MICLRSVIIIFLVAVFFGAALAAPQAKGGQPATKDTKPLYKVQVLSPKANQNFRRGEKITVKVKTTAPEGPQILQLHADLVYIDNLSPRPSQNVTYGFFGGKDIDGKDHEYTVITDGDLQLNSYILRLMEMTNNGVRDSTQYVFYEIPINVVN